MVKLSEVEPFSGMLAAPKALMNHRRANHRDGSIGRVARSAFRRCHLDTVVLYACGCALHID